MTEQDPYKAKVHSAPIQMVLGVASGMVEGIRKRLSARAEKKAAALEQRQRLKAEKAEAATRRFRTSPPAPYLNDDYRKQAVKRSQRWWRNQSRHQGGNAFGKLYNFRAKPPYHIHQNCDQALGVE